MPGDTDLSSVCYDPKRTYRPNRPFCLGLCLISITYAVISLVLRISIFGRLCNALKGGFNQFLVYETPPFFRNLVSEKELRFISL